METRGNGRILRRVLPVGRDAALHGARHPVPQPEKYRPSVILVDEPELGMHPYAITLLAALMKQASTASQVIVSTQSSLLLDHFEPEQVLVAERVDGATRFTRLESSGLESWLESYSLGQLWEKNELGGRLRESNECPGYSCTSRARLKRIS